MDINWRKICESCEFLVDNIYKQNPLILATKESEIISVAFSVIRADSA